MADDIVIKLSEEEQQNPIVADEIREEEEGGEMSEQQRKRVESVSLKAHEEKVGVTETGDSRADEGGIIHLNRSRTMGPDGRPRSASARKPPKAPQSSGDQVNIEMKPMKPHEKRGIQHASGGSTVGSSHGTNAGKKRLNKSVLHVVDPHTGLSAVDTHSRALADLDTKLLWSSWNDLSALPALMKESNDLNDQSLSTHISQFQSASGLRRRGWFGGTMQKKTDHVPVPTEIPTDEASDVVDDEEEDEVANVALTYENVLKSMFKQHTLLLEEEGMNIDDLVMSGLRGMQKTHNLTEEQVMEAFHSVMEREELFPGAIEGGFHIMLGHVDYLPLKPDSDEMLFCFIRLKDSTNLDAVDESPVKFLVLMIGRPDQRIHHADIGIAIDSLLTDSEFHDAAYLAKDKKDLIKAYEGYMLRITTPDAVEEIEVEGKKWPCCGFFEGVVKDIKQRYPKYWSDIKDGLHPKSISSTLFLFFAALTPAIAFGGLMDPLTGHNIGAMETILATSMCGIGFALFAGQPLIILGATGPMLVFTGLLYDLCQSLGLPFLPMYFWTGLWTGVLTILLAVFNASRLISIFTRFTDEIFSTLISVIFIYEAVEKAIHPFEAAHAGHDPVASLKADRSLLLALATFALAFSLKKLRSGRFLRPKLREFLADFGLVISVAVMTGAEMLAHDVYVQGLRAPTKFEPTNKRSNWFIDPSGVPLVYALPLCFGLALLASILIFLDQNITARLINKPENNLKKGNGTYHLDMLVVGVEIVICSAMGLPWMVASTVPSINHVNSLAETEHMSAHGKSVEHIVHVRENRITGVAIHALVGLSLLLVSVMALIPEPIIFGLFLYMGISSLSDNQFWDRVKLLFMDPRLFPPAHYVRKVKFKTIHKFTLIQIICLVVLWVIKTSAVALLFPLVLLMLLGVRWFIEKVGLMKSRDLQYLDAEEIPDMDDPAF